MTTHFDVLVIGAGSAGLAVAEKAAEFGRRVAVIDSGPLGGTCVNAGCVPKKLMWYAADLAHSVEDASHYGLSLSSHGIDWPSLVQRRDRYIAQLNSYWSTHLDNRDIFWIQGGANFKGAHTVAVGAEIYSAEHIVIATGGQPIVPNVPGAALGISSDGFFRLRTQPRRVAIIGGGYIGVELSGVLRALGSEVTLFARESCLLHHFDPLISATLEDEMRRQGIALELNRSVTALHETDNGISVHAQAGSVMGGFDAVIWAVGRAPNTAHLQLSAAGLHTQADGTIAVDDCQNTRVPGIYAVGDVTGRKPLTPVAVAAGRALAERLFDNRPDRKIDYDKVPSVVFTHPPIGTIGLTEPQALATYGDTVTIYETEFTPLRYALSSAGPRTAMKLVCAGASQHVVGIHLIGTGVDEMLQGFAVAMRMGATKADFDSTIAIHPSSAEELVTLKVGRRARVAEPDMQAA